MVTQDCHRRKRIMSVAWVYVKKAYGSVDKAWLTKMMVVLQLTGWICYGVIWTAYPYFFAYKTRTSTMNDVTCRLCGKSSEIPTHVQAGCSGLTQTKYLERHNAALKVLFFEMLRQRKLGDAVPPWFTNVDPKPLYKSPEADAYFDLPVFLKHTFVEPTELMRALLITGWTTAQRKKQRRPTSMGHRDWNYQENTQGTRSPAKCIHTCVGRMVQRSGEAMRS